MKKILVCICLGWCLSACDDKLEIPNPNTQTTGEFWKTSVDAQKGVAAIYAMFPKPGAMARWYYFLTDLRSDEGYSISPWIELQNSTKFIHTNYNFDPHYNVWKDHYKAIYRANQVLTNVPAIQMDETLKKQLLGEAHFLRAFYYFNLVCLWGNVPIVSKPNEFTELVPYSTEAQVWAEIEKDLNAAIGSLKESHPAADAGRATKGAAYALLGKALLQQKKYAAALEAFKWLVEGDGKKYYDLVANYSDNFRHTTEYNKESVFEISFSDKIAGPPVEGEDFPDAGLGNHRAQFFAQPGRGWSDGQCRRWVVNEFAKEKTTTGQRDPRLAVTCIFDSLNPAGPTVTTTYGAIFANMIRNNNRKPDEVWFHKYQNDYWRNIENYYSPINIRYIRYADVLLMYAEILNELNRTTEAYPYVDRVRERSSMAKLSVVKPNLSKADFLTQLKHERVVELAGESVRWNDLKRWGDLGPGLANRDPDFANFKVGTHELLPIPTAERDLNPNLEQNKGY